MMDYWKLDECGKVAEHRFTCTVGLYPDGTPGELFVAMRDEHGTMRGLLDCWAIAFSIALQHGADR